MGLGLRAGCAKNDFWPASKLKYRRTKPCFYIFFTRLYVSGRRQRAWLASVMTVAWRAKRDGADGPSGVVPVIENNGTAEFY
jgi:hypothetical protein